MRFSRARYVTLCQQSLVTAAVLAVGVSAAGVKTLDIVPQPGRRRSGRPPGCGTAPGRPAQAGERPAKTEVDAAPVTPKVREVKVTGISAKAQKAAAARPRSAAPRHPDSADPRGCRPQETPGSAKRLVALTEPQPVRGYATVGVTWKHGADYADDQIDVTGAHREERHVVALDALRTTTTSTAPTQAPPRRRPGRAPRHRRARHRRRRPGADARGDHRRQSPRPTSSSP